MQKIGPYEIIKEVGQGTLAIVYEAQDPLLKRKVALKVLHPIFSKNKNNLERLRQEAQTLAQLNHPNIIRIYEFLDENEAKGIVTEYMEGQNLAQFLEKHSPLFPEIACLIISDILSALEHAHSKRIVHRDIKPQNIIISREGHLKLADFSIAKIMDKECLTLTGALVGSPFYMSPEQALGKDIDERSDIFTTGILFYHLITGHLPFFDEDPKALFKKILSASLQKPSTLNSKISDALQAIILKALQKEKEKRYQKAWEFRYDILTYLKNTKLPLEEFHLKDFFDHPQAYTKTLITKLTQAYLTQGSLSFQNKKYIEASHYWNTVLELDPDNTEVQKQLKKLSSQKRVRQIKQWAALTLPFVLVGGLYLWPKKNPSMETSSLPESPKQLSEQKETPLSSFESSMPAEPEIHWAYLQINIDPDTIFYLDGKKIALDDSNLLRLPAGQHEVHFKKPGFKDIKTAIVLKEGETSTINIRRGS